MTMASVPEARGDENMAYALAPDLNWKIQYRPSPRCRARGTHATSRGKSEVLDISRQSRSPKLQSYVVGDPMQPSEHALRRSLESDILKTRRVPIS